MPSEPTTRSHLGDRGTLAGGLTLGATVRARVESVLRDRILLGEMRPASRIDLDAIAGEFGISRTPVREACLALANDGLVHVAPRSGITVIGVTPADTMENFAVMATLSGLAAAWAAERAEEVDLAEIRIAGERVVQAVADHSQVAEANWAFHRTINLAAHSERLMKVIVRTARMIPLNFFAAFPGQLPCSLTEHEQIIVAVISGDAPNARALMEAHFADSAKVLSQRIAGANG